ERRGVAVAEIQIFEDSGIVDEDVELAIAKLGLNLRNERIDRVDVFEVRRDRFGRAAGLFDLADQRFRAVRGAVVVNEHVRAIGGEACGDSAADSARCAGDESSLIGKGLGHGTLLLTTPDTWVCPSYSSIYPNYGWLEFRNFPLYQQHGPVHSPQFERRSAGERAA